MTLSNLFKQCDIYFENSGRAILVKNYVGNNN